MRFGSLEHFGISPWRITTFALGTSTVFASAVGFSVGMVLGLARFPILFVIASATFYLIITTPRRIIDRQRMSQAKDSVTLSAAIKATMGVVGSRCRTLALMRPRDESLAKATREAMRNVLLGHSIQDSVGSSAQLAVSYSAANILESVAFLGSDSFDVGDEEKRGLSVSSDLNLETKLPIFMTACFFAPIMLVLYSVFSGLSDPASLSALAAFEFVMIDIAFYLTAGDRGVH